MSSAKVSPVDLAATGPGTTLTSNYMPKTFEPQMEHINFNKNGDLLLTTNCLTGRFWTAGLFLYKADRLKTINSNKDTNTTDATNTINVQNAYVGTDLDDTVSAVQFFGPDDNEMLVGLDNGSVEHLSLAPPDEDSAFPFYKRLFTLYDQDGPVRAIARADGHIAMAGSDGSISVLAEPTLAAEMMLRDAHRDVIWDVTHGKDRGVWATASEDGIVALWDLRKTEGENPFTSRIKLSSSPPRAVRIFNSDLLICGQHNGTLALYDLRSPDKPLHTHTTGSNHYTVTGIRLSPNNPKAFAVSTESCSVHQFEVADGSKLVETRVDDDHNDFVRGLDYSPLDGRLWSSGWDSRVLVR